ncbi:MAG: chemotaxis protein CheX [Chloroherpetonaceae bacterium]|nr:chemotaxis protein CheX [Chthonomonadaceae bacterium]MDW8206485.1 chemotaxis protein CheX [Chloroherpetonaceae bacterium]
MKVEYVNPFVCAAFSVIEMVIGVKPVKGTLTARPSLFTSQQCNVITGVTGQVEGQVIYGMSLITADKVASAMLGQPIRTFDQLAASAIGELGNMISGNASTALAEAGFQCDITPPSIVRGTNVKISTLNIPALVVPVMLPDIGEIEIIVSLQDRR